MRLKIKNKNTEILISEKEENKEIKNKENNKVKVLSARNKITEKKYKINIIKRFLSLECKKSA